MPRRRAGRPSGRTCSARTRCPDRGNFRARIPTSDCVLEFRAVFQDGSEERRRQNICQNRRVQFGDPAIPLREATIRNETDTTLLQVFAAPPGAASRGPDRLGENVVEPSREFRIRLGRTRDCIFDVTAVFEDGEEETRAAMNLCRDPRLTFGDPAAPRREARVTNTADRTIREFYASTRAPLAWGADRLGNTVLQPGTNFTLRLRGTACLWDLRAVFDDDAEEVKQGIDLCTTREIAFDGSGAPRPPERRVTLVNRHGATIQEIYLSGTSEEDWGPDRLGEEVLPRGQRREIGARLRDCEADLRIVFEERRAAEERTGINLCETATIVLRAGWTLADRLDEGEEAADTGPRAGSVRLRNAAEVPVAELYADAPGAPRGPDRLGRTVLGVNETLDFAPAGRHALPGRPGRGVPRRARDGAGRHRHLRRGGAGTAVRRFLLAALLLAAAPAAAQGIPEPLRGTWAQGACATPTALLHVTARSVVRLPADGPAHLVRLRGLRPLGDWTLGTGAGAEAPRVLLRAAREAAGARATRSRPASPTPSCATTACRATRPCCAGSAAPCRRPRLPCCMARGWRCWARWRGSRPPASRAPCRHAWRRWWRRAMSRAMGCSAWRKWRGCCAAPPGPWPRRMAARRTRWRRLSGSAAIAALAAGAAAGGRPGLRRRWPAVGGGAGAGPRRLAGRRRRRGRAAGGAGSARRGRGHAAGAAGTPGQPVAAGSRGAAPWPGRMARARH